MILYKYYGYEFGLKALTSSLLGFRKPKYFNDPFELSFLSNSGGPHSKQAELKKKIDEISDSVVILSLTRTHDNALMWAHYGQEHSGFVVGYEVSDTFLSSQEYNLIPVISGDVVYSSIKSFHVLDPQVMERIHSIYLSALGGVSQSPDSEISALARKIFLTKHSSWVYEEEVRVVKILDSLFELTSEFQSDPKRSHYRLTKDIGNGRAVDLIPGLSIFHYKLPVKEIYLGVRNRLLDDVPKFKEVKIIVEENNSKLFKLEMDENSWGFSVNQI